jgi:hypothetical protein
MPTYVRKRNAIVAVKQETTAGTDIWNAGAPATATDYMRADAAISFNQSQVANPEMIGSLDDAPPIAAGTKGTVTLTCMARGSGAAGTAPKWGKLMPCCSYKETTVTAISATVLTAGTATTATLGVGYVATNSLYQGAPITLAVNPVTPVTTWVLDNTALVASLSSTFAPVLSTATTAAIPQHIKYTPTSDQSLIKTCSILVCIDGAAWRFVGMQGSWTLDVPTGGAGTLKFTMVGIFVGMETFTFPTGFVVDTGQPPIFIGGQCRLDRNVVRVSKMSFDAGVTVIQPENPEATLGFDPSIITQRDCKGSLDPLMSITETVGRMTNFTNGSVTGFAATLGTTAGNRIGVVCPGIMYTGNTPTDRNNLMAETLPFQATVADAGLILVHF